MTHMTIDIDEKIMKKLEVRAKANYLSVTELIEDIVRRSMLSYKKGPRRMKIDDKLVEIFSKENKGPKPKKKSIAS